MRVTIRRQYCDGPAWSPSGLLPLASSGRMSPRDWSRSSPPNFAESRAHAEKIRRELAVVPTLRDVRYGQALDYPTVSVRIDRERAGISGVTVEEIARSLVTATSSSRFVVPNYWPDPKTGIGYQVQVEVPYQVMDSVEEIATVVMQEKNIRKDSF